ncbi:stalk domain-containing protein [Pseudoflavonifractor sp. 524-17]|uniref:stalk domain-containing protein n=1 Tax=Pseudoflavonifractor sp. 524-17 TaxID=2304577 RepID=UPI00192A4F17|nr:stalk domain-containing protein [Pseudoflavonifractor sp. 524-17]
MKHQWRGFVCGILLTLVCVGLISAAGAAPYSKWAKLDYNSIKITLNGQTVIPRDANGNVVEPFAIDGVTYLPVRGVASALGMSVGWDAYTNTVQLVFGGYIPVPTPTPTPTPTPANPTRCYPGSAVPMLENLSGVPAYSKSHTYPSDASTTTYYYSATSMPGGSFADQYDALLTRSGFVGSVSGGGSGSLIYRSAATGQSVTFGSVTPADGYDGHYFLVSVTIPAS